ncbi:5-formyltetrahydrofolate cyclo-ligase [Desulfovibrio litoralis]|uniref:5-formyltetrahydrofolate cyclo-ligase n=1 Tax=Desulfovibrio litoralis DSM 11393 TaxID=1121455 RepID=A0A1M7SQK7_9BACT|nr:5-formyltetrahydrofolate cyclo-ligase [Desulfovibrio litoralis]SHN60837.1 5-formyltetrahydrofolate cyclo-ligase [Desulfovibrio litoralis DSM 11393]
MLKKNKSQIRQAVKALEAQVDKTVKNELPLKIQHNLLNSKEWKEAELVGLYMPLADEAQTNLLFKSALAMKKVILLPRCIEIYLEDKVLGKTLRSIEFVPCHSLDELSTQKFGILEPLPTLKALTPGEGIFTPKTKKTLFIIPGRAFDLNGGRLGRGAGYYDTYLSNPLLKEVFLVGYGFSFSVYPALPLEPHDIKMNALCTDKEFICFKS